VQCSLARLDVAQLWFGVTQYSEVLLKNVRCSSIRMQGSSIGCGATQLGCYVAYLGCDVAQSGCHVQHSSIEIRIQ
jgi:hypothetical protein